jgi:1,2-dihydroxy-3-keto-5-methylthiopentene dioxygenase
MAVVNIPSKDLHLTDPQEITTYLAGIGIDYERWDADEMRVSPDASEEEILTAYSPEIEKLKVSGGYVTADVINIVPTTPNLDAMLKKFDKEHWHDEDEIRFIVKGHGLFHIAPPEGDVVSIEMEAGDLIRVPRGTMHWFNLCGDRTVRAIRLFQDISGWTPFYSESGAHTNYQPMCFGADYIAVKSDT